MMHAYYRLFRRYFAVISPFVSRFYCVINKLYIEKLSKVIVYFRMNRVE